VPVVDDFAVFRRKGAQSRHKLHAAAADATGCALQTDRHTNRQIQKMVNMGEPVMPGLATSKAGIKRQRLNR
jgi:hypothetical protein